MNSNDYGNEDELQQLKQVQSGGLIAGIHWSEWGDNRQTSFPVHRVRLPSKTLIAGLICQTHELDAVLDVGAGQGLLNRELKKWFQRYISKYGC